MKEVKDLNDCEKLLSMNKYSSKVIKEIVKWYDYRDKKGVASFWFFKSYQNELGSRVVIFSEVFLCSPSRQQILNNVS